MASGGSGFNLNLNIRADGTQANTQVNHLTQSLRNLNGGATQVNNTINNTNIVINQLGNNSQQAESKLSKFKGLLGGLTFGLLANDILQTNIRFQSLRASLESAVGSAENADIAFKKIQQFAATTPYSVEEVTTAFIKLKNLGLSPSEEALKSYGNTAGAMGKSLDQFIEAVADATTGEFERLKEFGIKSSKEGDKVTFTFRGMSKTVALEANAIQGYLQDLGNVEFAGGMDKQAATMKGALSNLGDAWDAFKDHVINKENENNLGSFFSKLADFVKIADEFVNGNKETIGALTATLQFVEKMGIRVGELGAKFELIFRFLQRPISTEFFAEMQQIESSFQEMYDAVGEKAVKNTENTVEQAKKEEQAWREMTKAVASQEKGLTNAEIELREKIRKESFDREMANLKQQEADKLREIQNSGKAQQQIDKEVFAEKLRTNAEIIKLYKQQLTAEQIDMRAHLAAQKNYSAEELTAKKATLLEIEKAYKTSIDQLNTLEQQHRDKVVALDKEIRDLKVQGQNGLREIQRAGMTDAEVAADKSLEIEQKTAQMRQLLRQQDYQAAAELGRELSSLTLEQAKSSQEAYKNSGDYWAAVAGQDAYKASIALTTQALEAQKAEEKAKADAAATEAEKQRIAYETVGNQINALNETLTKGGKLEVIADATQVDALRQKVDDIPKDIVITVTYDEKGRPTFSQNGTAFANGGIMTANGAVDLKKYATGGIANSPQLALFGEGSKPEAFVPLPDGRTIPVTLGGDFINALAGLGQNARAVNADSAAMQSKVVDTIAVDLSMGGASATGTFPKNDNTAALLKALKRANKVGR